MAKSSTHDDQAFKIVKAASDKVMKRWGLFAWRQLGPDVRHGLLCAEVMGAMAGRDAEDTSTAALLAICSKAVGWK